MTSAQFRIESKAIISVAIVSKNGYDRMFRTQVGWLDPLWSLLCASVSLWLSQQSGLPVDFQIQRAAEANERYGNKPRNPLGMGGAAARIFAGGGDCTPGWSE